MKLDPMFFRSHDEFIEYINYIEKEWAKYETKIFYIMRFGYTLKECKECKWHLIESEFDFDTNQFIWEWDWYEGEQFIELLTVVSDLQIMQMVIDKIESIGE